MSTRLAPAVTPDSKFFWEGLAEHKLLLQRCRDCNELRHPPRPMCPKCNSLSWDTHQASGRGTLHSYVLPRHPPWPWFEGTYVVALVDLEEGLRLVSNLSGVEPADLVNDMPLEVFYEKFDDGLVLHQFRPRQEA